MIDMLYRRTDEISGFDQDLTEELTDQEADLEKAMSSLGIENVDDSELEQLCQELLVENMHVVEQVKDGKNKALGSLIGAAKKKNPNVDPRKVMQICEQLIQQM